MEVMYYNLDWLNEMGYDGPPTTWAEFKEMACAATDADCGDGGVRDQHRRLALCEHGL